MNRAVLSIGLSPLAAANSHSLGFFQQIKRHKNPLRKVTTLLKWRVEGSKPVPPIESLLETSCNIHAFELVHYVSEIFNMYWLSREPK